MRRRRRRTELKDIIYEEAKLICEKLFKKFKNRMENSTENAVKKNTKRGQNYKTKEKHWNMERQKGKGNTRKYNNVS